MLFLEKATALTPCVPVFLHPQLQGKTDEGFVKAAVNLLRRQLIIMMFASSHSTDTLCASVFVLLQLQLQGKTDEGFVKAAFKLLRDHLGVKTVLTPGQFLEQVRCSFGLLPAPHPHTVSTTKAILRVE